MIKTAGLLLSTLTLSTRVAGYNWKTVSEMNGPYKDVAAGADGSFWFLSDSSQ